VIGGQHADLEVLEVMAFIDDLLVIDKVAVLPST
jgi:hypothetical protein